MSLSDHIVFWFRHYQEPLLVDMINASRVESDYRAAVKFFDLEPVADLEHETLVTRIKERAKIRRERRAEKLERQFAK